MTVVVWQALRDRIEQVKSNWAHGAFVGDTVDQSTAMNAAALAEVGALHDIIELDFIEPDEDETDGDKTDG